MRTLIATTVTFLSIQAGMAHASDFGFSDGAGYSYQSDGSYQSYTDWGGYLGGHVGSALGGLGGNALGGPVGGIAGGAFGADFGSAVGEGIGQGAWEIDTLGTLDGIPVHQYPDYGMQ